MPAAKFSPTTVEDPTMHWLSRLVQAPPPDDEGILGFHTPPGWELRAIGAEPGAYRVVFVRTPSLKNSSSLKSSRGVSSSARTVISTADRFSDAWALARLSALAA